MNSRPEAYVFELHLAKRLCNSTCRIHQRTTAIGPSGTSRRYSSTYATRLFMPRLMTVVAAIDLSIAKRRCNSTYGIHQHMPHPLTMNPATATTGSETALQQHLGDSPTHQQDTETPLDVFFRSFPVFDYNPSLPPLLHMPSCRDTKDGAVGMPRPKMRGTDTNVRCKTNCTCGMVQRAI